MVGEGQNEYGKLSDMAGGLVAVKRRARGREAGGFRGIQAAGSSPGLATWQTT
jgi:hypothetical protein